MEFVSRYKELFSETLKKVRANDQPAVSISGVETDRETLTESKGDINVQVVRKGTGPENLRSFIQGPFKSKPDAQKWVKWYETGKMGKVEKVTVYQEGNDFYIENLNELLSEADSCPKCGLPSCDGDCNYTKEELEEQTPDPTQYGPDKVAKAMKIAVNSDGKYSIAVREIEKIAKDLSKVSTIARALKTANEQLEEAIAPFRLSYDDKYGKHAGFEDAKTLQDLQNKAQKLRAKGFKINKMGRNTSPVKEEALVEFSRSQLDVLARQYADLKGKTISIDNANKLRKIFDKIPDHFLNDLRKKHIPFLSGLALSRMIQKGIPVRAEEVDKPKVHLGEAFDKGLIDKAVEIAKKMVNNHTGATNVIEKIARGLSKDPTVSAALLAANEDVIKKESVDPDYLKSKLTPQQIANTKKVWQKKKASDVTAGVKALIKKMDIPTQLAIKQADIPHISKLIETIVGKYREIKETRINEGRMKDIYTMDQDGATVKEIAKKLKLKISTVKGILGEKRIRPPRQLNLQKESFQPGFAVRYSLDGKRLVQAYKTEKDAEQRAKILKSMGGVKDVSITKHTLNFKEEELKEGLQLSNLVGQSIAHLEMYVELAEDVKKEYFKTKSQVSMFTKIKAEQVLKNVPKLIKELKKPGIWSEQVELDEANIVFKAKAKEGGYFLVLKRDTFGMSGSQDKFIMRHLKGNKVKELGSHPSLDGAKTFGKNKGIYEYIEESSEDQIIKRINTWRQMQKTKVILFKSRLGGQAPYEIYQKDKLITRKHSLQAAIKYLQTDMEITREEVDLEEVNEGYEGTILAYLKKYADKAYFSYRKLMVKKGSEGVVKTVLTRGVNDRSSLIYSYDLPPIVGVNEGTEDDKAYAIGMSKAKEIKKDSGTPLKKSTIEKGHEIAKAIKKNEAAEMMVERVINRIHQG
jgi:hypothetical protein